LIVVDTNLLIYVVQQESPFHARAQTWWNGLLNGDELVGLPWTTIMGFVRVSTNSRLFPAALPVRRALDVVDEWLDNRLVSIVEPGERHWSIMRDLLIEAGRGANLTTDAHLATLCIERGGTLHTADGDFSRFRGLRWSNPLVER
jgi:uncharacterized protein